VDNTDWSGRESACLLSQDDDRVSLFDRSTWSGERLGGAVPMNDDKPETFVAQARNLLDSLQVIRAISSPLQGASTTPAQCL
jgi:hypothetical protein